jgi:RNA polymerase sigma-70 factor (ECF subfamily)
LTTPDSRLLEQAREYDLQALAEIYDRYASSIYRYLYRYLGDPAQAEDLTSDVFVRLLQVLGTRQAPRKQLRGWLYRVAHNLAMDSFRQDARSGTVSLDEHPHLEENGNSTATDNAPVVILERNQTQEQLRAAVRQLTRDQQQVILLRFGEGLKISDVSELMGKSEGAIKVLQHRAVKRLRKMLDGEETVSR